MSAGEMSAGEMSAGEMSAGEMSAGEMNAGEELCRSAVTGSWKRAKSVMTEIKSMTMTAPISVRSTLTRATRLQAPRYQYTRLP